MFVHAGSHFETSFEKAKLISQSFIPKYKNMCLTVVFHSEKSTTIKNLMNVYVQDLQLSKFFVGSIEGDDGFKVKFISFLMLLTKFMYL